MKAEKALDMVITAKDNWDSHFPNTISLVKGQSYKTPKSMLSICANGGWIFVYNDSNGQSGFVPMSLFTGITCYITKYV